jgi:hypothetical protein
MANTYVKIGSTVTVGVLGAASIDFTSIPSTYTDLKLVISARTNRAVVSDGIVCKLNSATTGYNTRLLEGDGAAASSYNVTSYAGFVAFADGASATSNTFSSNEFYFPNYLSSNSKSVSVDSVNENNATTAYADLGAGLQTATTTISSITLTTQLSNNFVQYSTASLYGIKST